MTPEEQSGKTIARAVIPCAMLLGVCLLTAGCSPQAEPNERDSSNKAVELEVSGEPTALCDDGQLSFAVKTRGACSGHGGVKVWFETRPPDATAICTDGSYSASTTAAGTCSKHGGVAWRFDENPAPR